VRLDYSAEPFTGSNDPQDRSLSLLFQICVVKVLNMIDLNLRLAYIKVRNIGSTQAIERGTSLVVTANDTRALSLFDHLLLS
jgi:hypothetical protein